MKLEDVPRYYDRASRRYDRRFAFWFGRVLRIERLRERAIESLGDIEGATVLDVGCGTGVNLPFLVSRVGPKGRVIGVDYSEGMLAKAREKVERGGEHGRWSNVELHRDDASRLSVVTEPVDAVLSTYCLGIVHDLDQALDRILELLRPGGHLSVLDFQRVRPDHGPLRLLYPIYRWGLQASGVDSPEDLDDERLRDLWARGRARLRDGLEEVREQDFLYGMGLSLTGKKA